jgi:hypothetical protein
MPVKARYWKNPEHHRKEARTRQHKLILLGFKSGLKKHSTYLEHLKKNNEWNKTHRPTMRKAEARYRDKIRSKMGSYNDHTRYYYARFHGTLKDKLSRLK